MQYIKMQFNVRENNGFVDKYTIKQHELVFSFVLKAL